jgi:hypothetical protein
MKIDLRNYEAMFESLKTFSVEFDEVLSVVDWDKVFGFTCNFILALVNDFTVGHVLFYVHKRNLSRSALIIFHIWLNL